MTYDERILRFVHGRMTDEEARAFENELAEDEELAAQVLVARAAAGAWPVPPTDPAHPTEAELVDFFLIPAEASRRDPERFAGIAEHVDRCARCGELRSVVLEESGSRKSPHRSDVSRPTGFLAWLRGPWALAPIGLALLLAALLIANRRPDLRLHSVPSPIVPGASSTPGQSGAVLHAPEGRSKSGSFPPDTIELRASVQEMIVAYAQRHISSQRLVRVLVEAAPGSRLARFPLRRFEIHPGLLNLPMAETDRGSVVETPARRIRIRYEPDSTAVIELVP